MNHRATVHYEHTDAMQELFARVDVSEELVVYGKKSISFCGGVASVDFALHIIKVTHGDALANAAARHAFSRELRFQGAMQSPGLAEPQANWHPTVWCEHSPKSASTVRTRGWRIPVRYRASCAVRARMHVENLGFLP